MTKTPGHKLASEKKMNNNNKTEKKKNKRGVSSPFGALSEKQNSKKIRILNTFTSCQHI